MILVPAAGGLLIGGAAGAVVAAVTAAAESAPSTDYAGIAMIIAACGSVIGTIGGIVIALRRRDSATAELVKALRELEHGGDDSAP